MRGMNREDLVSEIAATLHTADEQGVLEDSCAEFLNPLVKLIERLLADERDRGAYAIIELTKKYEYGQCYPPNHLVSRKGSVRFIFLENFCRFDIIHHPPAHQLTYRECGDGNCGDGQLECRGYSHGVSYLSKASLQVYLLIFQPVYH
ncbi:hypothetical protein LCGC14_3014310, partial [marine sediment metagenome]